MSKRSKRNKARNRAGCEPTRVTIVNNDFPVVEIPIQRVPRARELTVYEAGKATTYTIEPVHGGKARLLKGRVVDLTSKKQEGWR